MGRDGAPASLTGTLDELVALDGSALAHRLKRYTSPRVLASAAMPTPGAIMEREFPEAEVTGYERLIAAMKNHEKALDPARPPC
jgi:hypothetical protein